MIGRTIDVQRVSWMSLIAVLLAAVMALAFVGGRASAQPLNGRLESVLAQAGLGERARVSLSVVDLGTGQTLAAINPDTALIPASNMKVLTSGTALAILGPDYVFRTELARDGDRLIVRGSGDPALGDPDLLEQTQAGMTVEDLLRLLAEAVAKGFDGRVSEIIVDDRVFDRVYVHPAWEPSDLNRRYAPEVSGLNFHGNLLWLYPRPAPEGPGHPPRVAIQPHAAWIEVVVAGRTTADGADTAWIARDAGSNRFRLHGDVRTARRYPEQVPTHNNPLLFGQLLADRLLAMGVRVGDETRPGYMPPAAVRLAEDNESLPQGVVLAAVTTPIADVLRRCNTDSNNMYAEALLKLSGQRVTGEPGSWANGSAVVRMLMQDRIGEVHAARTVVADGSGLCDLNRVSASTLTAWLASFERDDRLRGAFMDSLAVPGEGTFTRRFQGMALKNLVAGKSGTLMRTGVRTLSGYIVHPVTGRRIAYAVLVNGVTGESGPAASRFAERVVGVLDEWLAGQEASAGAFGG